MKSANLALRFLLEVGALAGLAYWGWQTGTILATRVLLGIGVPLIAAAMWGRFIAPKAPRRLEDPVRAGLEIMVFGAATVALVSAGAAMTGAIFGAAAAVSLLLMVVFGQRGL